ncbi:MAG: ribosome maturation factor RimP [Proteobacteria bacterium]|nr:MAG: ribosome maturation factor RimP [Pseudomonadota bacterium]
MSASDTVLTNVRKLAEDVSAREGCYLYDIEFVGMGAARVLRVTIEKEAGGVSVEDCTNVSRGMNVVLDAEDVVPGDSYSLEVSSPGLERVLKEPRHYERAIGKKISLKSFAPLLQFNEQVQELGKAKSFEGKLLGYDDKALKVAWPTKQVEGAVGDEENGFYKEVTIPFETITKAHTVFEYIEKAKPGQKSPHKGKSSGGSKK